MIVTLSTKIILRFLRLNDAYSDWLIDIIRDKESWAFPIFLFLTHYPEYILIYASILFSLKSNVAPSRKELNVQDTTNINHTISPDGEEYNSLDQTLLDDGTDSVITGQTPGNYNKLMSAGFKNNKLTKGSTINSEDHSVKSYDKYE